MLVGSSEARWPSKDCSGRVPRPVGLSRWFLDLLEIVLGESSEAVGLSSFWKAVRPVSLIRTLLGVMYEQ